MNNATVAAVDLECVEDLDDSTNVAHGRWHDRHLKVTVKVSEASCCMSSNRRRLILEHVMSHIFTQTQSAFIDPELHVLRHLSTSPTSSSSFVLSVDSFLYNKSLNTTYEQSIET